MASEKRIKDFEPASDIELDDWFAIDSPSVGTRKIQLAQMLDNIQSQVTAIADELSVLDGEVETHDTSISNLQTKVGTAVLDTLAQDLSGGVNELNSNLTNLFIIKQYTYSYSLNANTAVGISPSDFQEVTPSGYEAIGVINFSTGQDDVFVRTLRPTGTTLMNIKNSNLSLSRSSTATIGILYKKILSQI